MSADDVPDLPDDARAAVADAKRLVDPGDAVRARMRARLLAALPPVPDGGGDGDAGAGAGAGAGASAGALPKVSLWVVAAAFVVGGAAGLMVPRAPVERVVVVQAPAASMSAVAVASVAAVPALPALPALPTVDMKDLPSVPSVVTDAGAPRSGADLAAERALLDVARTALGRGDGANALSTCDDHARKFPRGALAEEREAIAVQALVLEHHGEDARVRAERFRKSHPRSILLPAVLAAAGIEP
jgi:hypothetical protein